MRTLRDVSTVRVGEDGFDEDVSICAACGEVGTYSVQRLRRQTLWV